MNMVLETPTDTASSLWLIWELVGADLRYRYRAGDGDSYGNGMGGTWGDGLKQGYAIGVHSSGNGGFLYRMSLSHYEYGDGGYLGYNI